MTRITGKYSLRFGSLGIALTACIIAGAASGSCVFGTNINFCEQFGLHCEVGQQCAAHQAVCIPVGGCGDGITDPSKGEMCDDGNIEDYQMANGVPVLVNGMKVLDDCSHDCTSTQKCGNEIPDPGEDCDHGASNGRGDDSCDQTCHFKKDVCGNKTVDTDLGEQCDEGSTDTPQCNGNNSSMPNDAKCHVPTCGDGYTNMTLETCDNLGGEDTDSCNGNHSEALNQTNNTKAMCHSSECGDGYVNTKAGEVCDNFGGSDTELCNGNLTAGSNQANNAAARCQAPMCGDGYVNTHNIVFQNADVQIVEACDTGSDDSSSCNGNIDKTQDSKGSDHINDGRRKCRPPSCGDGYINKAFSPDKNKPAQKEECDDGPENSNAPDRCRTNCRLPRCGDGVVDPMHGEACERDSDCNGSMHCNSDCRCV